LPAFVVLRTPTVDATSTPNLTGEAETVTTPDRASVRIDHDVHQRDMIIPPQIATSVKNRVPIAVGMNARDED
jgi:hypothetical protein